LVILFILSVYASLLGPVAAIGGIFAGALWRFRQHTLLVVAITVSAVAFGYLSALVNPETDFGAHIYFEASHFCALTLWAVFTALLTRFVPEELPSGRRNWLINRAKIGN
jgi:hypothetical protein